MKTNKNHIYNRRGISAVESVVAGLVFVIVTLGISGVLAHHQRLWNEMYNRTYSDVFVNGHLAKKMFDAIVRKSSKDNLQIGSDGSWVEVCYYADETSAQLDCYARFFYLQGALFIEHGQTDPRQASGTFTVCDNVTHCTFRKSGNSVYMLMTINDGRQTQTIGSSAEMHN